MSEIESLFARPARTPENAPYWDACNERRLLLKRCRACGEVHFHPRAHCPFCFSAETEWVEASGKGSIYSFTVMRRAAVPYVLAYVELEEGVSMMTHIVDADPDVLEIGRPVGLDFRAAEGGQLVPVFVPTASAHDGS